MTKLNIRDFIDDDEHLHIARTTLGKTHIRIPAHEQNYPEVFWVESGEGIHLIHNQKIRLTQGDLVFIRRHDIHALRALKGKNMQFVNVAFRQKELRHITTCILSGDKKSPDFWSTTIPLPKSIHLSKEQLNDLQTTITKLTYAPNNHLMMTWFFLDLFRIIFTSSIEEKKDNIPPWLSEALIAIQKPPHFARGATALASLAHRSPEHVSRTTKKYVHKTPSQIVNEARISYASQALTLSDDSILNISLTCGFQSLAQFYALFKKTHTMTPRQYRLHHRRIN